MKIHRIKSFVSWEKKTKDSRKDLDLVVVAQIPKLKRSSKKPKNRWDATNKCLKKWLKVTKTDLTKRMLLKKLNKKELLQKKKRETREDLNC
jgi:hypothetical protein